MHRLRTTIICNKKQRSIMPIKPHLVRNSVDCRLLYVVGQLGAGGLERQLYFLLQGMDRERYQPAVAVWNFSETDVYVQQIRALGVPLYSLPRPLLPSSQLRNFRRLVKELNPEVVHSYSFYTNIAAWWATLGTDSIAVGAVRSDFVDDKASSGFLLGRLSARWPSKQIYNSFAAAEKARNFRTFFAPRQVFVVQNRLDLQQFQKIPLSTNGPVRILGVGSLLQYKRWDRLLRAALDLKQRDLHFLVEIAGGGPLRESLARQARDLEITDRLRFTGHADDVPGLMAMSTLLAHTSDVEGCPNVVMEAMACGRAVVAMAAGDIPSLVEDGKTGFVVRRGDDAQFVERLATLITNRELCSQMGEASRVKAEREFGLHRLVEETLNAYREAGWRDF
jgi:glycosyltransferase involved in cell wall biosynthesis